MKLRKKYKGEELTLGSLLTAGILKFASVPA